jgi:hypothetical protein
MGGPFFHRGVQQQADGAVPQYGLKWIESKILDFQDRATDALRSAV